ncbi:MAG TPA: hypothetical protein VN898_02815 [Candidatus Binatia bacterium]|nr:hypothetical protein [Candidatus Binatia bacterium]
MTRSSRTLLQSLFAPVLLLAAALAPAGNALALDRGGYSMEVLIGGTPVHEYAARGTSYVEALKNREYSVRLTNRTAGRIAVALSVDGLNSIDARTTTARDARKWILGPYESITLDGWQVSSSIARRFFFTTEEKSYGSWLGKTKNLGLVAAAVFRERQPIPIYSGPMYGMPIPQREERGSRDGESNRAQAPSEPSAGDESMAAPAPPAAKAAPLGDPDGYAMGGIKEQKKPDDLAATGIGQETSHPVQQVYFDAEDAPSTVLELRYEYRDSLVRLGVVPPHYAYQDSLSRRERARGFQEPGFAPDPFRSDSPRRRDR